MGRLVAKVHDVYSSDKAPRILVAWNRPFGLSLYTSSHTDRKAVRAWLSHVEDHKPGEKRNSSTLFASPLPVLSFVHLHAGPEDNQKTHTKKKGKKNTGKRKGPIESSEDEDSDEGEYTQKNDEEDEEGSYARFGLTVRRAEDADSETDRDDDNDGGSGGGEEKEDCPDEVEPSLESTAARATKRRAVSRQPTLLRRLAEEILVVEKKQGGKGGTTQEKNYDLHVDLGEQRPVVLVIPLRIMHRKNFQGKVKSRFTLHKEMKLAVETRKSIFTLKKQ